MPLAEDQDMIQALAPERSDQALTLGEIGRSRIPIVRSRRVTARP
jgi:hypothetical protein